MWIFRHCSVLSMIVSMVRPHHQHFHQQLGRGIPCQSSANCRLSSPSSPFLDRGFNQLPTTATFNASQCDAARITVQHNGPPDIEPATDVKSDMDEGPVTMFKSTSDTGSAPAEFITTMSSAMATALATASVPPESNPANLTGGKKGLAYNSPSLTSLFAGKGITWAYNWAADANGPILSDVEYVAMLWGENYTDTWFASAAAAIASGTTHVLSFNEPDLATQANMDPNFAAQQHIKYLNPLAGQVSIGSPAITNGGSPMGIEWLRDFFIACDGQCEVDFMVFHWYDAASNLAYFEDHVKDVISFAQGEGIERVWLTEFGASGTNEDVASFLTQAVEYLDSNSAVERYAYFMCDEGILVEDGQISAPIGEAYVNSM